MSNELPENLIEQYIHWLEKVRPESVKRLASFMAKDIRYHTPVMEASGPENVAHVFEQTYIVAPSYTENPQLKFRVLQRFQNDEMRTVFLRWDCVRTHGNISGATEMMIDMKGKVIAMTDYWDRVPVVKEAGLLKRIFRK